MMNIRRTTWNFVASNQLCFGPGSIGAVGGWINRHKFNRVLVVTDLRLEKNAATQMLQTAIDQSNAQSMINTGGSESPTIETAKDIADAASEFGADLLIGLGGGSNLDLAKTVSLFAANDEATTTQLFADINSTALLRIPPSHQSIPTIAIPTTAGSGSEATDAAQIRTSAASLPKMILGEPLRPIAAFVDPQLALTCPEEVTAASGMTALASAIEAYLATNFFQFPEDLDSGLPFEGNHPLGDLYAERAISLIGPSFKSVAQDPDHLASRTSLGLGASLAGSAAANCGRSLTHALANAIRSQCSCKYGQAMALVLPHVLRFWSDTRAKRIGKLAELLGIDGASKLSESDAIDATIEFIEALSGALGLPRSAADLSNNNSTRSNIAENAMQLTAMIELSPKTVTQSDIEKILSQCGFKADN